VGVSGCGRKAGLDPPPASTLVDPAAVALDPSAVALDPGAAAAVEPVAVAPPARGGPLNLDGLALQAGLPASDRPPPPPPPQARSLTFLPETPRPQASPVYGPDGKPVIPKPPEKKWFILDWLID
jgi:hypothetical protein